MNNFLSLKLYKNNDLYLEKKSLNYAKTNNKYEFSLEDVLNTIIISEDAIEIIKSLHWNLQLIKMVIISVAIS